MMALVRGDARRDGRELGDPRLLGEHAGDPLPRDDRGLLGGHLEATELAEGLRAQRARGRARHLARHLPHERHDGRGQMGDRCAAERRVLEDRGGPASREAPEVGGERLEAPREAARLREQAAREDHVRALLARGPAQRARHHGTRRGVGDEPSHALLDPVTAVAYDRERLTFDGEQVQRVELAPRIATRRIADGLEMGFHLRDHDAIVVRGERLDRHRGYGTTRLPGQPGSMSIFCDARGLRGSTSGMLERARPWTTTFVAVATILCAACGTGSGTGGSLEGGAGDSGRSGFENGVDGGGGLDAQECSSTTPAAQGLSQPCCLSWGADACGAGLFCGAFDGRTVTTCYPERSPHRRPDLHREPPVREQGLR